MDKWSAWKFYMYSQIAPKILLQMNGGSLDPESQEEAAPVLSSVDDMVESGLFSRG